MIPKQRGIFRRKESNMNPILHRQRGNFIHTSRQAAYYGQIFFTQHRRIHTRLFIVFRRTLRFSGGTPSAAAPCFPESHHNRPA